MHKVAALLAITIVLGFFGAVEGRAGKRIALVFGNGDYTTLQKLQKSVNGAHAVAGTLKDIGFTVMLGENLSRRTMYRHLAEFRRQLDQGDEALFFYAGHAVRYRGRNYLLPIDFPQSNQSDNLVDFEALAVDLVMNAISTRKTRVGIVILDASRRNPLPTCTRCIPRHGLARTDVPANTFVLYSAGAGEVALDMLSHDDPNPHSIFVRSLLPLLKDPELKIYALAKQLQRDVHALARTVGHDQRPAYFDTLLGDYHLGRSHDAPRTPQ